MSAEEFHSALQNATNFPLRGFVLPYLKHTLPSLQKDLSSAARINNQVKYCYISNILIFGSCVIFYYIKKIIYIFIEIPGMRLHEGK